MNKGLLLLAGVACLLLLILFAPDKTISPGHLGKAHTSLEKNCLACHELMTGVSTEKCIQCHKLQNIGLDTATGKVRREQVVFHKGLQNQQCTACHTDHLGPEGKMTKSGFDHNILPVNVQNNCATCHGSPQDKLHAQVAKSTCVSCHSTSGWKMDTFNHNLLAKNIKDNCAGCHADPSDQLHQQVAKNACASCHTTSGWKIANFNHNTLAKTIKDKCGACHTGPKDDLHAQQSANSCSKCHSTNQWKPATFDHDDYFVFDRHHPSNCKNCHDNNNYAKYTCLNCHEHNNQELFSEHREEGITNINDCARCHRSGNEHDTQRGSSEGRSNGKSGKNRKNNKED